MYSLFRIALSILYLNDKISYYKNDNKILFGNTGLTHLYKTRGNHVLCSSREL